MPIPDPITTGVALAGALQVAKQAQDFIAAAAGRKGETIGTILGDITRRRIDNTEAVGSKAHFILLNIGVTPREVPLNILGQILEGASWQEDPDLQSIWANLLANAANPQETNRVAPSFAAILKELSPPDAKLIQQLYTARMDGAASPTAYGRGSGFPYSQFLMAYNAAGLAKFPRLWAITQGDMNTHAESINADLRSAEMAKDLLIRCGLLQNVTAIKPVKLKTTTRQIPGGTRTEIPQSLDVEHQINLKFTQLGLDFVRACQPLKADQAEISKAG